MGVRANAYLSVVISLRLHQVAVRRHLLGRLRRGMESAGVVDGRLVLLRNPLSVARYSDVKDAYRFKDETGRAPTMRIWLC
jgi:hypothetical protein